jgi:hypothetical protein
LIDVPAVDGDIGVFCGRFTAEDVLLAAMDLTAILNQCYPQPGFVYLKARFRTDKSHRRRVGALVSPTRSGTNAVFAVSRDDRLKSVLQSTASGGAARLPLAE